MLDALYHKTKQNMFGLVPPPQTPAHQTPWPHGTWEGWVPEYIELRVLSGARGLGLALLALRGSHGESPEHQSVEVRKKKGLKFSTEPEKQYPVLGCTEISIEMLIATLFSSLCPACLGN